MGERGASAGVVYDADKIERAAMSMSDMPRGINLAQQCLYLAYRNLYAAYRAGKIDRDKAHAEKTRILQEYNRAAGMFAVWDNTRIAKQKGEAAVSEYMKNPTIESADMAISALYGMVGRKGKA